MFQALRTYGLVSGSEKSPRLWSDVSTVVVWYTAATQQNMYHLSTRWSVKAGILPGRGSGGLARRSCAAGTRARPSQTQGCLENGGMPGHEELGQYAVEFGCCFVILPNDAWRGGGRGLNQTPSLKAWPKPSILHQANTLN